jgi:hypothetical protein
MRLFSLRPANRYRSRTAEINSSRVAMLTFLTSILPTPLAREHF